MIAIRAEVEADHERVLEIQAAAFGRQNEADLVEALRRSAHPMLSLVAEEGGGISGHVFFSPVGLDPPATAPPLGGLAPVAVEPERQGQGIGSALIRAGLERCPALGWQAVFLVGNPAYYARFGFELAAPTGLRYGDPRFDPVLQVLEFQPGALAACSGRLCFHPAFAETGCG
ncbi:MAG: N-acetyltransferase [Myxococcales bacterium]|nr:N-acetyltransferase [Myxococcales bacterium]